MDGKKVQTIIEMENPNDDGKVVTGRYHDSDEANHALWYLLEHRPNASIKLRIVTIEEYTIPPLSPRLYEAWQRLKALRSEE